MSIVSSALNDRLVADATLVALVSTYRGEAAVFTVDPPPDGATLPYIISAGEVVQTPFDTKNSRGRELWRDVRCYALKNGSAVTVEAMAERVRALLHRQPLTIAGFGVWLAECTGPIVADEDEAYGRIVTVRMGIIED